MKKVDLKLSAKNKRFWALSKKEKRIAIAKDVIRLSRVGKIEPTSSTYLYMRNAPEKDGPLDKFLAKQKDCECCALGACFYSLVALGDNITINKAIQTGEAGRFLSFVDDTSMRKELRKIFSHNQLALMESAFERAKFTDDGEAETTIEELKKAIAFGNQYQKDDERVVAIMKNIIENDGTFKP